MIETLTIGPETKIFVFNDTQLKTSNNTMIVMFFSEDISHLLSELGNKLHMITRMEAMHGLSSMDFFSLRLTRLLLLLDD